MSGRGYLWQEGSRERVRISECEQGRLHVLKLVSMASGDSVCPAVCPAPGLRESCWAVGRKETRHQGPDQPVWLSWRPIWDPGAGPTKSQMRIFLVPMP